VKVAHIDGNESQQQRREDYKDAYLLTLRKHGHWHMRCVCSFLLVAQIFWARG
jgi:hypothetical protein